MGMYDYIVCKYPLPGTPPEFCTNPDHQFQTKSLECRMFIYEITVTGELRRTGVAFLENELKEPEPVKFHGVLEFYDGNSTAAAFGVTFTQNGEDYEWVTYNAMFDNGIVQTIVETERERRQALARHLLEEIDARFDNDEPEVTMTEPEIGQTMYLQWRDSSKGYPVTLSAKSHKEWAVVDGKGKIAKLYPTDLGRLLFHSQEESDRCNAWRERTRELKQAYAKERLKRRVTNEDDRKTKRSR